MAESEEEQKSLLMKVKEESEEAGLKPNIQKLKSMIFNPISSVQFSSVTQSCLTLWDPMNHSTPGLPVHHQLLEFTQTHIHLVSDAIQPSHPLSSPSLALIFPSIRVFSNVSALRIRWPKHWSFSFSLSNE